MKNPDLFVSIAERLMRCPAAPYFEHAPAAEVMRLCAEHSLPAEFDRHGNILARVQRGGATRPVILAAHLDHPGFAFKKRLESGRWSAEFLGGVGEAYFKPGIKLLACPGGAKAVLGTRLKKRMFEVLTDAANPEFAVWDLPEFQRANGLITGRACDDLIGAACILAALIELQRGKGRCDAIGAFSRAEEVGFHGALALAQTGELPKEALLISLETSRELPPVKMGGGAIVRVGDRSSTFDSAGTRYLAELAGDLARRNLAFRFQRALMGGGTCEATAYQEHGYRCAAVCVALGNYHNCGKRDRIRAEFVSESDSLNMVRLMVEAARNMHRFESLAGRLPKRLELLARAGQRGLRKRFP